MRSPHRSFVGVAAALVALAVLAGQAPAAPLAEDPALKEIQALRKETWRWQRLMRVPLHAGRLPSRGHVQHLLSRLGAPLLAHRGTNRAPRRPQPGEAPFVALHPRARGPVERQHGEQLLRRPPDGHGLPARLGPGAPAPQGNREPLAPDRADLGRRARVPKRPRLQPLAEHVALLRPAVAADRGPDMSGPYGRPGGSAPMRRPALVVSRTSPLRLPAWAGRACPACGGGSPRP